MNTNKAKLLKRVRIAFTAVTAIVGIGGAMAMKADQTPAYYLSNGVYTPLPGGAAGEGSRWFCDDGSTICTYDQNQQAIGSADKQIVLMP